MNANESSRRSTMASDGGRSPRGRTRLVAVCVALLVVTPLVGGPVMAPPATRSSIASCTTIDKPGVYTLSKNIGTSDEACIQVAANDVTINGAGHRIHGDGGGVGIRTATSGLTNVSVNNLTVSNWTIGVHYRSVDGGRLKNVTATRNEKGIALHKSRALRMTNSIAWKNGNQGVHLVGTDDSTLAANQFLENAADGVILNSSTNNSVRANVAGQNGDDMGADGFHIANDSHQTTLRNNVATNNTDDGINVHNSSQITLVGNNASFNAGVVNADGIEFRHSNRNDVRNNVANGNVDDGIDLKVVNDTTVAGNVAHENVNDGIPLARAHDNDVRNNVATNNSRVDRAIADRLLPKNDLDENSSDGLTIRSNATNNTLTGNTASGNHGQGIRIWLGAHRNTVTNNTAADNGDDGIAVLNASSNTLARNDVRDNEKNGIHLNNEARHNELTENQIHDNRLSGILLHTANDTRAAGNVVTRNGGGPNANGIRVGHTADATLLHNPVSNNEGANVSVINSTRIRILETWDINVTDSENVTIVHSWLLREAIPTAERRTAHHPDER